MLSIKTTNQLRNDRSLKNKKQNFAIVDIHPATMKAF